MKLLRGNPGFPGLHAEANESWARVEIPSPPYAACLSSKPVTANPLYPHKTMALTTRAATLGMLAGLMTPANRNLGARYLRNAIYASKKRAAKRQLTRYRPKARKLTKRKWQARARRQVAAPRNYSTAKTTESIIPTGTTHLLNSMHQYGMIDVEKGTGINQRQRNTIVVSGVLINAHFANNEKTPIYINWAVIHPKHAQLLSNNQEDFFRDYTDVRAWNANSTGKTGLSWSVAKINTDDFVILKRGKFKLAPRYTTTDAYGVYNAKDNDKQLQCYVKLGRQFAFEDDGNQDPHDQVYFVVWGADPDGGTDGSTTTGYRFRLRTVVYFREPKTG